MYNEKNRSVRPRPMSAYYRLRGFSSAMWKLVNAEFHIKRHHSYQSNQDRLDLYD